MVVVGTSSLFLYEAMAAVQLESQFLSTVDIDLLWDARQSVTLAASAQNSKGVLAILRRADRSFERSERDRFRAVNKEGFYVDVIRPIDPTFAEVTDDGDIAPVEINGLDVLMNAPKIDDIVIGDDGKPLRIWSVDPRVFALHKFWLADRLDRPATKRMRDRSQAEAALAMAQRIGLSLDDKSLSGVPKEFREFGDRARDASALKVVRG